jgi:hypothetical protein
MTQEAINMTASSPVTRAARRWLAAAGWLVPVVHGLVVLDESTPH